MNIPNAITMTQSGIIVTLQKTGRNGMKISTGRDTNLVQRRGLALGRMEAKSGHLTGLWVKVWKTYWWLVWR